MSRIDDYYHALGLSPGAGEDDVRRAYKALVLRYHPDRGEGSNAARFREVQEAYEILTDESRREEFRREEERSRRGRVRGRGRWRSEFETEWLGEDQVESLARDLFGWREPRLNRHRAGIVEVILTPDEARRGVQIPLHVPRNFPCRECAGRGAYLHFFCPACAGSGMQQYSRTITLNVPPHALGISGQELILDGGLRVVLRVNG